MDLSELPMANIAERKVVEAERERLALAVDQSADVTARNFAEAVQRADWSSVEAASPLWVADSPHRRAMLEQIRQILPRDPPNEVQMLYWTYAAKAGSEDKVMEAAIEAIRAEGTGTTGSRIANGSYSEHVLLEEEIAAFYESKYGLTYDPNTEICVTVGASVSTTSSAFVANAPSVPAAASMASRACSAAGRAARPTS